MNKNLQPTPDAIKQRKRRRRDKAIPKIYQNVHDYYPEDDTLDVMRVSVGFQEINKEDWL